MDAILLTGGKGTRLGKIRKKIPKPLVNINGRTLLERQLENLIENKFDNIFVILNYKKRMIKHFLKESSYRDKIKIIEHNKFRGIGEAILLCEKHVKGREFGLFLCDDVLNSEDIKKLKSNFTKKNLDGSFHYNYPINYPGKGITLKDNMIKSFSKSSKKVLYYDGIIKKDFFSYLKKYKPSEMQVYYAMLDFSKNHKIGTMLIKNMVNVNTVKDVIKISKREGQKTWEKLYSAHKDNLINPQKELIDFYENYLKSKNIKLLDLAGGNGRHSLFLAEKGIDVYSTDISKSAIKFLNKEKNKRKLKISTKVESMDNIHYPEKFFDAIICLNSIHHGTFSQIENRVKQINLILKKGGIIFLNLATNKNQNYRKGIEIEKNTFISNANVDMGEIHHFFSKREALKLLTKYFKKINFFYSTPNHWYFVGIK